jgi:hypothetical protein
MQLEVKLGRGMPPGGGGGSSKKGEKLELREPRFGPWVIRSSLPSISLGLSVLSSVVESCVACVFALASCGASSREHEPFPPLLLCSTVMNPSP